LIVDVFGEGCCRRRMTAHLYISGTGAIILNRSSLAYQHFLSERQLRLLPSADRSCSAAEQWIQEGRRERRLLGRSYRIGTRCSVRAGMAVVGGLLLLHCRVLGEAGASDSGRSLLLCWAAESVWHGRHDCCQSRAPAAREEVSSEAGTFAVS
jgi:hypothetical protein